MGVVISAQMQHVNPLVPGTHWRQSWIQHGRLCWKSTKSTVSLWPRTHWQRSWPYRQQSWTYTATVDFVAGFGNSRLSAKSIVLNSTFWPVPGFTDSTSVQAQRISPCAPLQGAATWQMIQKPQPSVLKGS